MGGAARRLLSTEWGKQPPAGTLWLSPLLHFLCYSELLPREALQRGEVNQRLIYRFVGVWAAISLRYVMLKTLNMCQFPLAVSCLLYLSNGLHINLGWNKRRCWAERFMLQITTDGNAVNMTAMMVSAIPISVKQKGWFRPKCYRRKRKCIADEAPLLNRKPYKSPKHNYIISLIVDMSKYQITKVESVFDDY